MEVGPTRGGIMSARTEHKDPRGSAWRQLVLSRWHRDHGELTHLGDEHRTAAQREHIEDLLLDAEVVAQDVPRWRLHEAVRGWWTGGP